MRLISYLFFNCTVGSMGFGLSFGLTTTAGFSSIVAGGGVAGISPFFLSFSLFGKLEGSTTFDFRFSRKVQMKQRHRSLICSIFAPSHAALTLHFWHDFGLP